jgi:hypothetical protein
MEQGDIVQANNRLRHPHPIVFLEAAGSDGFLSCTISSKKKNGNLEMRPEYFKDNDENGNPYKIVWNNSHLIRYKFYKMANWVNSVKIVGKLTDEGIKFVLDNIPADKQVLFHPKPIWDLKIMP